MILYNDSSLTEADALFISGEAIDRNAPKYSVSDSAVCCLSPVINILGRTRRTLLRSV